MFLPKIKIKSFNTQNYLRMCDLIYKHSLKQYKNVKPRKITMVLQGFEDLSIENKRTKLFIRFFLSFGGKPYFIKKKEYLSDKTTYALIVSITHPIYIRQLLSRLLMSDGCDPSIFSFDGRKRPFFIKNIPLDFIIS